MNKKSCLPEPSPAVCRLYRALRATQRVIVFAESCTAGLAAGAFAGIPGASEALWGSYVVYTAEAKQSMLGISAGLIERYGAVSRETASAMAEAALEKSGADIAAAVTGLAGPDAAANPTAKPCTGDVWFAVCRKEISGGRALDTLMRHFSGSRNEVRAAACEELFSFVLRLEKKSNSDNRFRGIQ